jgi:hypothetical protein
MWSVYTFMARNDVCFTRIEYEGEAELYDILQSAPPISNKNLTVHAQIRDTHTHTHARAHTHTNTRTHTCADRYDLHTRHFFCLLRMSINSFPPSQDFVQKNNFEYAVLDLNMCLSACSSVCFISANSKVTSVTDTFRAVKVTYI